MKISIEEIRAKYPKPQQFNDKKGKQADCYCVGGAFCLFTGISSSGSVDQFPDPVELRQALLRANWKLTTGVADKYANKIISANDDDRDFEAAWKALDEALRYGSEA